MLSGEQADDVRAMINELGRHEATAIDAKRWKDEQDARVKAAEANAEEFRCLLIAERRALWDGFASAALAGGRTPTEAGAMANTMMELRKARKS